MSIKEISESRFPNPSIDEWKAKGTESLKGKSPDTLGKNTFENIQLKPLYTKEDQNVELLSQFPGQSDFRRGMNALEVVAGGWEVAQKINVQTKDELKNRLAVAFKRGQTAISFEIKEEFLSELPSLLEPYHEKYPYSLNGKGFFSSVIDQLSTLPSSEQGKGYIGKDPVALLAEYGAKEDAVEREYNEFYKTIEKARENLPNVKTILVDTVPYHNGGANAVQELAIAVGTGVLHIEELSKRGLSLKEILTKIVFQFSIGSNFFMELAKIRAARILWSKIIEAYGEDPKVCGMTISACTSSYTKTVYDPYVNMLRSGSEAFAGVLGGVQYLHVTPFNEPEGYDTEFSARIAQNTQLILKEEAHLTDTIDPAGGSWYVEQLTDQLAEKAWKLFLAIEDKGGMIEALRTGWIQDQIREVRQQRIEAINTRKQTIVGTNKYANLHDEPLKFQITMKEQQGDKEVFIEAIQQERISEPYEKLRSKADELKEKGIKPQIGLLTLGKLKEHKARADFITGFLSPGGVEAVASGELDSLEDAFTFIEKTKYQYYCICGSNDQYKEAGLNYVKEIKNKFPDIRIFLAGLPDKEEQQEWIRQGVEEFIHIKSNCYETLSSLLKEMEVGENE